MNGTGEEKKTSPWVYVAIGCSIPILLIAILLGATMFWGYRVAKQIRNPAERAEHVKDVLGCKEIPEGYHAMMSLSIPLLMDLAILSDRPPEFDEKKKHDRPFEKKGFIYVNAVRGKRGRTIRDYIDGKADASEILGEHGNVQMGDREEIGRGSFPVEGATAYYIASRGSLVADRQPIRGIVTIVYFDCADRRFRMGVWFGPDPREGQPLGTPADYAGSHADEREIQGFISHFAPCTR